MLPAKRSNNAYLSKLSSSIFENSANEDFDILISLDNENISLRDFSAFLLMIDHFYGRNYRKGFQSYSLTESAHLRASEIKAGSIEIEIAEILKYLPIPRAVYFFLLIKYLPTALKSLSETLLKISEALYNFEKVRLVRRMRKNLRRELREDEDLKDLSDDDIIKLASNLQKKYNLERNHIYKAARFASEKMKSVRVRKRK